MRAQNFKLPDQNGQSHQLADYAGKWLVLFFYPKDFSPGCTTQVCSYRDFIAEIRAKGAEVLGVSLDSVESHKKFHDEHNLGFDILSDPSGEVAQRYGVAIVAGTTRYAKRTTFLIDPRGEIIKTYENVDPTKDASNILKDLEETTKK